MSLEKTLDTLSEALTMRIIKKLANSLPMDLTTKVKEELLAQEATISASVQQYLVSAIVKHLMRILIQKVDVALAEAVRQAILELPQELRLKIKEYVKQELRTIILQLKAKFEMMKEKKEVSYKPVKVSAELEARVRQMSDLVAKFFNLMLKFEPRFHVLPFLEEMKEATIDELASMLSMRRDQLVPFLEELERAGFVKIRGNTVTLVRPIFNL